MPTHGPDLSALSVTQLCELAGCANETGIRRLRRAQLAPVRTDGRTLYFAPPIALRVLLGVGDGIDGGAERARLDRARAAIAEQEYAKRSGELLAADDVRSEWSRRTLTWKERVRSIPANATVHVPGFTKEQGRALLKLIDQTLTELADGKGRKPRAPRRRNATPKTQPRIAAQE